MTKLEYGQDPAAADRLQKISATLPLETRSSTAKVICRTLSRDTIFQCHCCDLVGYIPVWRDDNCYERETEIPGYREI